MNEEIISQQALFDRLPPEWPDDLLPTIQKKVRESGCKVVVLDDDPTGTQTVHGIPVLTEWPVERLTGELTGSAPALYLLTNSRSLPPREAQALAYETGRRLVEARAENHQPFVCVSRSDSTLRGHFPGEVQALADGIGEEMDAWLVIPFFIEGGRFTIDDIHYVAGEGMLVPAGQTEFARDKAFGYRSSNLREWVAEKTGGSVSAGQVASISITDLRAGGPQQVTDRLLALEKGAVCIVNAASYRDLEVFVLGLLEAEAAGRRYLYRTAASFVRVRAGILPRALLTKADFALPATGAGLVIAGSYVPRTSAQLETLLNQTQVEPVEVQVERLLDGDRRDAEVLRACQAVNRQLEQGRDTAIFTSRKLVSTEGAEANLAIGRAVSDGLVQITRRLSTRPRYLLAKGGITSSDIATQGLGIRRAIVLGQVLPGVPVWQCGDESRFPGMPYIVFPGNVGGVDALARIVNELRSYQVPDSPTRC